MKKIFSLILNLLHHFFGGGKELEAERKRAEAKDKKLAGKTKNDIAEKNKAKAKKAKGKTIDELQSKKKFIFAICVLLVASASCIPSMPRPITQVVNNCTLPEPYVKPELPTVKYKTVGGEKCFADLEQEENAKLREILLIEYANNITELYLDAMGRCNTP